MRPSMGSVGDAYDNAMCESFFATLECELLDRRRFASQAEARMACFSFIEGWYNPVRRHSALGYRSPIAYEAEEAGHDRTVITQALTLHEIGATSGYCFVGFGTLSDQGRAVQYSRFEGEREPLLCGQHFDCFDQGPGSLGFAAIKVKHRVESEGKT